MLLQMLRPHYALLASIVGGLIIAGCNREGPDDAVSMMPTGPTAVASPSQGVSVSGKVYDTA